MTDKFSDERLKARRTPNSEYAPTPPAIASTVDSTYYAVDSNTVEQATRTFRDQIVTTQIVYKLGILASARVIFEGTRWEIYHERDVVRVVELPNLDWEKPLISKWDSSKSRSAPEGVAFYNYDAAIDFSQEYLELLEEDFVRYLMSHEVLELYYNPVLRLYRKLDETDERFFDRCLEKLRENYEQELRKLEETISWQEERLKEKLDRQIREHGPDMGNLMATTGGADGEPAPTAPATAQAVDSLSAMADIREQLAKLQTLKTQKLKELNENLVLLSRQQEKDYIRINRGQVRILRLAYIWLPYTEFVVQDENGARRMELVRAF